MEDQKVLDLLKTLMDGMNKRFDGIDQKLAEHDQRFERIDQKLKEHDQRFNKLEEQNKLEHQLLMQAIKEVDNNKFEILRVL
jgi:hypothetical protein